MMFQIKIISCGLLLLMLLSCNSMRFVDKEQMAQHDIPPVEREFRAAWVATVANIDWPSQPGLTTDEQMREAVAILDTLQNLNMNAVIFQVRPQCDALYQSDLEPWSYYLTGDQGKAPEPFYDPLEFWINEAHKRGMELHAWFNPYRAHHPKSGEVTDASIVRKKPQLVKKLEHGYYWLDPAKQGTQDHSISVVMDVVKRYDIDGVHFDDYFYPYPSYNDNKDFPDEDTWQDYLNSGGKLSRADWRRDGVNKFIERLYSAIKKEKPWVKFGLSPFGIYRPHHPQSVEGFDQFEVLYADARLWLHEGWLDYFTPQLYWPINRIAQSYPVLLGYWNRENSSQRNLWPGLYTSKMIDSVGVDENINQIMIARGIVYNAPGHVHFSVKAFLDTTALLNKALLEGPYRKQALVPVSHWLDAKAPQMPKVLVEEKADSLQINWSSKQADDVFLWVVYFEINGRWRYKVLDQKQNMLMLPREIRLPATEKSTAITLALQRVAVSAVDRTGNESAKHIILLRGKPLNK